MYYVYILHSEKDKKLYIGFTSNLKKRLIQHKNGEVNSTSKRLPVNLIYFECYLKKQDAERNESYYKTSKGKEDLRKKLKSLLGP
ncbi:MAG: GIY-YIG nuclease family protein [Candidatus Moranbacteria bacterium]|nr:GIY-YIG nuclease family protein [Candidatus Moranbacteria bacterium]